MIDRRHEIEDLREIKRDLDRIIERVSVGSHRQEQSRQLTTLLRDIADRALDVTFRTLTLEEMYPTVVSGDVIVFQAYT